MQSVELKFLNDLKPVPCACHTDVYIYILTMWGVIIIVYARSRAADWAYSAHLGLSIIGALFYADTLQGIF